MSNEGRPTNEGYAAVTVTFMKDKEDPCEFVTSLVGNLAGAVSGIAGGFFGTAGDILCTAISG